MWRRLVITAVYNGVSNPDTWQGFIWGGGGGGGEGRPGYVSPPRRHVQNNANYTGIALFLITLQASTILFKSESESSLGPSIAMPGVGVGVTKG